MIAYVDSPFQLLQSYELSKLGHNFSKIYVRLNGKESNDNQLINLINLLDIQNTKLITIVNLYQKLYYYGLFIIVSLFKGTTVVGDANSVLFKILKRIFSRKKFILLDDGVATINNTFINKCFKRFTIFPEYVKNKICNDFKNTRLLVSEEKVLSKKHVIVGAKFVDEGICDRETYITALSAIIKYIDADEYVYIPHRGESKIEIEAIKNTLPISVLKLNLPIELISLEAKIYPLSISHTLSTAVFSMNKIYDAPIYTYRIPDSKLIQRKASIENLYNIIDSKRISQFIK
ncbi:hypothetical protein D172_015295 [Pseudoalteromonas sp. Bsw20308]|uniref:hypothetical protein n=1 Tax=Pseudoalteromonas sp. Bsw20308 TaxID=283699 RepID=UPI0002AAA076|nr:hypothetical protein [Pseudoalteromonas sp. Bsw20308]ALQ09302.1 hypothetical protein D172_015295 [Pseudoalteromonas sp. Bsw20308]